MVLNSNIKVIDTLNDYLKPTISHLVPDLSFIILVKYNNIFKLLSGSENKYSNEIDLILRQKTKVQQIVDETLKQYKETIDKRLDKEGRLISPILTNKDIEYFNHVQCKIYNKKQHFVIKRTILNFIADVPKMSYISADEVPAYLFSKIYFSHCFLDGNKRTALMTMLYYLLVTGHMLPDPEKIKSKIDHFGNNYVKGKWHLTRVSTPEKEIEKIMSLFYLRTCMKKNY